MHRDLTGQTFGNLKVIEYAGTRGKVAYWRCACTCGNIVEVRAIHLTKGATKSCGCLKKQKAHNRQDLTGQRFGKLTVLKEYGLKNKKFKWLCLCDCGTTVSVSAYQLTKGKTKSCGCLRSASKIKDLVGQTFGNLTVLSFAGTKNYKSYWLCRCACGNYTTVLGNNLQRGIVKSCGCAKHNLAKRSDTVELAKFFDKEEGTIRNAKKRLFGNIIPFLTEEQKGQLAIELQKWCPSAGSSTKELAKELGRSKNSITNVEKKLFGSFVQHPTEEQKRQMQAYFASTEYLKTADTADLCNKFNKCKATISKVKQRLFGEPVTELNNEQIEQLKQYFKRTENSHYSYTEKEIVAYIKSIYKGEVIENDRELIAPKEIDIYIPEKKLAIEYNGLIWHSSKFNNDKYYHLNKTKACEEKGVRLIHIFSCAWESKKEIIKSMLASALGVYERKEYARTLEIREVTDRQAINKFFDENHMQGSIKTWSYGIGLFKGEELLQACLFGGKRFKGEKATELLRMATKLNTQVIGGFSKLMKHCPYDSVVSYVHRTYFNGTGYLVGNWKLEGYTEPELYYTDGKDIYSRHLFNKEAMKKSWEDIDETKTQREIAEEHGFYQLYGSGNIKVRWTR